jgi:two-component system alkaline phosphatase synthesis response regulator PhoP
MDKSCEKRALVVHDEPAFTATLTKAFAALGFVTDVAVDCRAAIDRVALNRPDVVCVSLNLPRESGYDLCEQIRKNPELDQVQILVLSDRHSPEIVAYAEEAGANAFLTRPFKMELLEKYVVTMLEMRGRVRDRGIRYYLGDHVVLE